MERIIREWLAPSLSLSREEINTHPTQRSHGPAGELGFIARVQFREECAQKGWIAVLNNCSSGSCHEREDVVDVVDCHPGKIEDMLACTTTADR